MLNGMTKRHYEDGIIIITMPNNDLKMVRKYI